MIFSRMLPVCSEENVSVEKKAIIASQATVGSQPMSLRLKGAGAVFWMTEVANDYCLFQPVIRSLASNDHVMDVAFAQARAADADEPRLLLKLCNGTGAAISHAGAQAAHKLIDHRRHGAAIRNTPLNALPDAFTQTIA